MFAKLRPEETELVGMWLDLGVKVTGDAICDRVIWLTESCLERIAAHEAELAELYRDPQDGRLWERLLPFPGGPPTLRLIATDKASAKYNF